MSKFIIEIKLENGENKQVKVCVDNRTAEILNQCDARIRQIYLEEEYRAQNRERAETRKHISMEALMENGQDYISRENSPMDKLLNREDKNALKLKTSLFHYSHQLSYFLFRRSCFFKAGALFIVKDGKIYDERCIFKVPLKNEHCNF